MLNRYLDNEFGDSDFGGHASTGGQQMQFQAGGNRP